MAVPMNDTICRDFLEFQGILKDMRTLDDKIIFSLNTSIPTGSFAEKQDASKSCQQLFDQLLSNYQEREQRIKRCIEVIGDDVQGLKKKRSQLPDDLNVLKELRKQQTTFRLLQTELNVEEVIRDRTLKVYYERCRAFYKPPNIHL